MLFKLTAHFTLKSLFKIGHYEKDFYYCCH